MVFSIKTKHMLTIQPSHWVPTYLTEMKINARTKSCTQRQVSLFLIVPNWKQPQRLMLTDELMSEQTEYPNYRNWSSLRHRLQACSHPICLKDIILSRKSHLEIGFSIGDSIQIALSRWQKYRDGQPLCGCQGWGQDWEGQQERQRSYSGTTVLPCDCSSTRTQIRLYGTCICVEMASNYAQIVQTLLSRTCGTQRKAETSLRMLAPFCKALKRDITVKTGSYKWCGSETDISVSKRMAGQAWGPGFHSLGCAAQLA